MSDREQLLRWQHRATSEFYRIWLLAIMTYGAGDVITTWLLVYRYPLLVESNPVVRWGIDMFGLTGLITMKAIVFIAGILLSWNGIKTGNGLLYYLPPAGMTVFGIAATTLNFTLLI